MSKPVLGPLKGRAKKKTATRSCQASHKGLHTSCWYLLLLGPVLGACTTACDDKTKSESCAKYEGPARRLANSQRQKKDLLAHYRSDPLAQSAMECSCCRVLSLLWKSTYLFNAGFGLIFMNILDQLIALDLTGIDRFCSLQVLTYFFPYTCSTT